MSQDGFFARLAAGLGPRQRFSQKSPFAAPCPVRRSYVIGDIHGDDRRLCLLLDQIEADARAAQTDPTLVFVGDYIDRGEDSRRVLERVFALSETKRGQVICLMGNHERMLLEFLSNPRRTGLWLRCGGLQTLASYGVGQITEAADAEDRERAAMDLRRRMEASAPGILDWLRARPRSWQNGNLFVSHAGGSPTMPIPLQTDRDLVWGHPQFGQVPRSDGFWAVCGHWTVPRPKAADGTILIDTGAGQGGDLTAVAFDAAGGARFMVAGDSWLSHEPTAPAMPATRVAGIALPSLPGR